MLGEENQCTEQTFNLIIRPTQVKTGSGPPVPAAVWIGRIGKNDLIAQEIYIYIIQKATKCQINLKIMKLEFDQKPFLSNIKWNDLIMKSLKWANIILFIICVSWIIKNIEYNWYTRLHKTQGK